ncbi:MAG: ABC transporter permease [Bdellovibrionales bacterium]|nr:ABC transporter permease [Bdellovibrionales bacterium]
MSAHKLRDYASYKRVFAVWQRHFATYRANWFSNFFAPIYEPILLLIIFGSGFSALVETVVYLGVPTSYLAFLVSGMLGITCVQTSLNEGAYCTFTTLGSSNLWKSRLSSPLNFEEIFLGDLLWGATKGIVATNLVGVVIIASGNFLPYNLLLMQPVIWISALLLSSLGVLIGSLSDTAGTLANALNFINVPMLLVCGAFFPRSSYPPEVEFFVSFLPLSPILDIMRAHLAVEHPAVKFISLIVEFAVIIPVARYFLHKRVYES